MRVSHQHTHTIYTIVCSVAACRRDSRDSRDEAEQLQSRILHAISVGLTSQCGYSKWYNIHTKSRATSVCVSLIALHYLSCVFLCMRTPSTHDSFIIVSRVRRQVSISVAWRRADARFSSHSATQQEFRVAHRLCHNIGS